MEEIMRKRTGNCIRHVMAFTFLCLIFFCLPGCTTVENRTNSSDIYCLDEPSATYAEVIAQSLPSYTIGRTTHSYPAVQQKNVIAVEAFEPQALPALKYGVAKHWYPQYLATVIIAVDRDKTNADIDGWKDLSVVKEEVGIIGTKSYDLIFSAIAYGLEGENYTFSGATYLLGNLRKNGFLRMDSNEPAIVICFDFEAVALMKSGRNVEIVVPCEGTFSYERGLLSNDELSFSGDPDLLLAAAGFRLLDGRCDDAFYPAAAAYETTGRILDYDRFNTVCLDGDRIFRRDVLNTRLYSSADGREHQLFPLFYMIILIVWTASVFRRAIQQSVKHAALVTGIILLGWMMVRLIKFQIIDETTLGLYLWYSFSLFQLALPLVALWLAHAIDRPDDKLSPKWLLVPAVLNGILVILVFTNHFHNFVYQIDFSKPRWANTYGYGPGYIIIQFVNYALLGLAVIIMMIKCGRSARKKSLIFPIAFLAVLVLYGYGYFTRIPLARDSDIVMVTGLIALLFFETALRTGLIPVNTKYTAFFSNTTLKMQVTGCDAKAILSSMANMEYNSNTLADALTSHPLPLLIDENTLLFANEIRGGTVFWQEDVTKLNRLNAEIDESVSKLSATNVMLVEEGKIKRVLAEENEREQLMTRLEAEIAGYTDKMSVMAQQLENGADRSKKSAEIAMLLCYVKRRCNLFFREQEARMMLPGELAGYLEELAGIANYSNIKMVISSDVCVHLSVRRATLFYDFFYNVFEWATLQCCSYVMVHFREGSDGVMMRLLPDASSEGYSPNAELFAAIMSSGGKFTLENLDDATAISLSFPRGGEDNV